MPAATFSLGPSYGLVTFFIDAQYPTLSLNLSVLAENETFEVTAATDTQVNEVSLDGLFHAVVLGSGFTSQSNPINATIAQLQVTSGGTVVENDTFSSTRYSFTSSDGTTTVMAIFTGFGLPTSLGDVDALTTNNPSAVGSITGLQLTQNGTQLLSYALSSGSLIAQIGPFTLTETGSFPGSLSSAFIAYTLYDSPFTFPDGSVTSFKITQGDNVVANAINENVSYAAIATSLDGSLLPSASNLPTEFDTVLAGVSAIDASALGDGVTIDLRAGGEIMVTNGGFESHDFALSATSVIGSGDGDTLVGGATPVAFTGGGGGDTLTGHSGNDVAVYSAPRADYTIARANGIETITDGRTGTPDGTDTLQNIAVLQFSDQTLSNRTAAADFFRNGDSDIAWQNTATGQVVLWNMNATGIVSSPALATVGDAAWRPAGIADFNGDGASDMLWYNSATGQVAIWDIDGGAVAGSSTISTINNLAWQVTGVGDFDGDGEADILWRNSATGQVVFWDTDGTSVTGSKTLGSVGSSAWQVAGVGDFTGSGSDDILWANSATGQVAVWTPNNNGATGSGIIGGVANLAWQIVGIGDFTGDGKDDILWQDSQTGQLAAWQTDGTKVTGSLNLGGVADLAWTVVGVGDYYGAGTDSILWQNGTTGQLALWEVSGGSVTGGGYIATVSSNWSIVHNPEFAAAGIDSGASNVTVILVAAVSSGIVAG